MNSCPNNQNGDHRYTYAVGSGVKSDFEAQQFGANVEDTLYKRVEYSVMACSCGLVKKERLVLSPL